MKEMPITLIFITLFLNFHPSYSQVDFTKITIGSTTLPTDIYPSDLNGDGHIDLLLTSKGNNGEASWWENDGMQNFSKHLLGNQIPGMRCIRPIDYDQDGDIDLLSAAYDAHEISLWINDGDQNFTKEVLESDFKGAHTIDVVDFDQDGDPDFLCSGFSKTTTIGQVAWWENQNSVFTKHTISERFKLSTFILGTDLNGDGYNDILSCCEHYGDVVWWKNDGSMGFTEHVIDENLPKAHTLAVKDLDKDGDPDILAAACLSNKLAWYRNEGEGIFRKNQMNDLGWALWMDAADFDFDGDYDMVATGMNTNRLVAFWNNGNCSFDRNNLNGSFSSGFALNICDLDQDDDPDILAIGNQSNTIVWYQNQYQPRTCLDSPVWIDLDNTTGNQFVSNQEKGEVIVIKNNQQSVLNNSLGISGGIEITNKNIYVATGSRIVKLDSNNGENRGSIRLPAGQLLDLEQDTEGNLYAADPVANQIIQVNKDLSEYNILPLEGPTAPRALWVDTTNNHLAVLDQSPGNNIYVFSLNNFDLLREIDLLTSEPGDICGDKLGRIFYSLPGENLIMMINPETDEPIIIVDDIMEPTGITLNKDQCHLSVVSKSENTISQIALPAMGVNNIKFIQENVNIGFDILSKSIIISGNLENISISEISVYSINGRIIGSLSQNKYGENAYKISVSDIFQNNPPLGIYLIELKTSKGRICQKISVLK